MQTPISCFSLPRASNDSSVPFMWSLSRSFFIATLLLSLFPASPTRAAEEKRLMFLGDVMLAREVEREADIRRESPWAHIGTFGTADFVMANFEGAMEDPAQPKEGCKGVLEPCFEVPPSMLSYLREAGITAAGLANNHANDLGEAGLARTRQALRAADIDPLGFDDSPGFVRIGNRVIAIVAVNVVKDRKGSGDPLPSREAERKLRLARSLADWVIVSIHWGAELKDWPQPPQKKLAAWLIDRGADAIVGHHPHVVIAPECIQGKPVFYSLGNHVFDQKYPDSKKGLIADCRIKGNLLNCQALQTQTSPESAFPRLDERPIPLKTKQALAHCTVPARSGLAVADWRLRPWTEQGRLSSGTLVIEGQSPGRKSWRMSGRQVLSAEIGTLDPSQPPFLFTVERHPSPMDGENSPRPYVYAVSDRGLVARWRGTALAWPLVDARLLPVGGETLVCALHRADSFLQLNPQETGTRTAVYRWNGFGFSAANDDRAIPACQALFAETPAGEPK